MKSIPLELKTNALERSNTPARTSMAVMAVIAWFALGLQFYLMVIRSDAQGAALLRLIANYFSFFTILTNLLIAVGLTWPLVAPDSGGGTFFSQPAVTSATAVYIAIVGVTYSLLLRHLWNPQGGQKVADILLHDAMPLMYVAYWLIFVPKGSLRWNDIPRWLIYPLCYLAYALARGATTGWYPYPFLDAGKLGYLPVLLNAAMISCGFLGVSFLAVAVGRWSGRDHRPA